MNKIVLDTNLLLLPHTHKIDVFEEIREICPPKTEAIVPESVFLELENIAKEKTKRGQAAKVALALIEKKDIKILGDSGFADDSILKIAEKQQAYVATNDKELTDKLKKKGVKVLGPLENKKMGYI